MRISDWSSDGCSSDLGGGVVHRPKLGEDARIHQAELTRIQWKIVLAHRRDQPVEGAPAPARHRAFVGGTADAIDDLMALPPEIKHLRDKLDRKSTRLNSSH